MNTIRRGILQALIGSAIIAGTYVVYQVEKKETDTAGYGYMVIKLDNGKDAGVFRGYNGRTEVKIIDQESRAVEQKITDINGDGVPDFRQLNNDGFQQLYSVESSDRFQFEEAVWKFEERR